MGRRTQTTEDFIRKMEKQFGKGVFSFERTEYRNALTRVTVTCPKHGDFERRPSEFFTEHRGCPLCMREAKMKIKSVGVNNARFTIDKYDGGASKKAYLTWYGMLRNSYDIKHKHLTHKVCEEWKQYSNFKKWYDENYHEGWKIDKKLLRSNARTLSPETCCYLPRDIFDALRDKEATKDDIMDALVLWRDELPERVYKAILKRKGL